MRLVRARVPRQVAGAGGGGEENPGGCWAFLHDDVWGVGQCARVWSLWDASAECFSLLNLWCTAQALQKGLTCSAWQTTPAAAAVLLIPRRRSLKQPNEPMPKLTPKRQCVTKLNHPHIAFCPHTYAPQHSRVEAPKIARELALSMALKHPNVVESLWSLERSAAGSSGAGTDSNNGSAEVQVSKVGCWLEPQ